MDFSKILNNLSDNPQVREQLSGFLGGADQDKVEKGTQLSKEALFEQLKANSRDPEGAKSLDRALTDHEDRDFQSVDDIDENDGHKMLKHIFGDKEDQVTQKVSQDSGLDLSQAKQLLAKAAPMVMAFLANQRKTDSSNAGADDSSGLSGLIEKVAGQAGASGGFMEQIGDQLGGILGGLGK